MSEHKPTLRIDVTVSKKNREEALVSVAWDRKGSTLEERDAAVTHVISTLRDNIFRDRQAFLWAVLSLRPSINYPDVDEPNRRAVCDHPECKAERARYGV